MKIKELTKNAGWFSKSKPAPKVTRTPAPAPAPTPAPVPEPPPIATKSPAVKDMEKSAETNMDEMAEYFASGGKWSLDLNTSVALFIGLLKTKYKDNFTKEKESKILNGISEEIKKIFKEACLKTNLHFVPQTQLSDEFKEEMSLTLGKLIIKSLNISRTRINEGKEVSKDEYDSAFSSNVKSLVDFINRSEGDSIQRKIQSDWQKEQREREQKLQDWRRRQQENEERRQDDWRSKTGRKTYNVIKLKNVEQALNSRIDSLNRGIELVNKTLEVYRNCQEEARKGVPLNHAFQDLSIILETEFSTKLDLG